MTRIDGCISSHSSRWHDTHTMYGNQYVDQRSPALQPCHSFSALYANTTRARVRDRPPIVVEDYHCFTSGSNRTEPKVFLVMFWLRGPPPFFFAMCNSCKRGDWSVSWCSNSYSRDEFCCKHQFWRCRFAVGMVRIFIPKVFSLLFFMQKKSFLPCNFRRWDSTARLEGKNLTSLSRWTSLALMLTVFSGYHNMGHAFTAAGPPLCAISCSFVIFTHSLCMWKTRVSMPELFLLSCVFSCYMIPENFEVCLVVSVTSGQASCLPTRNKPIQLVK